MGHFLLVLLLLNQPSSFDMLLSQALQHHNKTSHGESTISFTVIIMPIWT